MGAEAEDEDEEEPEVADPPAAARVAARCGVLVALAYRSLLEASYEDRPDAVKQAHEELVVWVAETPVGAEAEPAELDAVRRPVGALSSRERRDLSWLIEGAVVLAWALGLVELPGHDEQATSEDVANAIEFLARPWPLPDAAFRRDEDEIEERLDGAIAFHWRLRQQDDRPGPMNLRKLVGTWASLSTPGFRLGEEDLLLRGTAVSAAPEDLFHECMSIAQERHRALEWLVGGEALWSEVTTDT